MFLVVSLHRHLSNGGNFQVFGANVQAAWPIFFGSGAQNYRQLASNLPTFSAGCLKLNFQISETFLKLEA